MTWRARWNGSRWRWWSLAAGAGLVLVAVALAVVLSAITGERTSALLTVGLLVELFVLSVSGTGMLAGTTRRMSFGGLTRETATLDVDNRPDEERALDKEREYAARDRRTIRSGIMVLPVLLTLIYLLFR